MKLAFTLAISYAGESLLSGFNWFTDPDPTWGQVSYQSRQNAEQLGLFSVNDTTGSVRLGVDHKNKYATPQKRPSIRLESQRAFTSGLFIADFLHMPPARCGVWPAYWMYGPDWPNSGELDIIEGANLVGNNQISAHTADGCTLDPALQGNFSGQVSTNNCFIANDNVGCGYRVPPSQSSAYGDGFNKANGGIYAVLWDSDHISVWHFARSEIPDDINSKKPDPTSWKKPLAIFGGSTCQLKKFFKKMNIVINITFCGAWGEATWSNDCGAQYGSSCANYVLGTPKDFSDAYWEVNYIDVYDIVSGQEETTSATSILASSTDRPGIIGSSTSSSESPDTTTTVTSTSTTTTTVYRSETTSVISSRNSTIAATTSTTTTISSSSSSSSSSSAVNATTSQSTATSSNLETTLSVISSSSSSILSSIDGNSTTSRGSSSDLEITSSSSLALTSDVSTSLGNASTTTTSVLSMETTTTTGPQMTDSSSTVTSSPSSADISSGFNATSSAATGSSTQSGGLSSSAATSDGSSVEATTGMSSTLSQTFSAGSSRSVGTSAGSSRSVGTSASAASSSSTRQASVDASSTTRQQSATRSSSSREPSATSDPLNPDRIGDYTLEGCFSSTSGFRTFNLTRRTADMTLELCMDACNGRRFFGLLQDGCYCADVVDPSTRSSRNNVCDIPCPGNGAQFCGGRVAGDDDSSSSRSRFRRQISNNFLLTVYAKEGEIEPSVSRADNLTSTGHVTRTLTRTLSLRSTTSDKATDRTKPVIGSTQSVATKGEDSTASASAVSRTTTVVTKVLTRVITVPGDCDGSCVVTTFVTTRVTMTVDCESKTTAEMMATSTSSAKAMVSSKPGGCKGSDCQQPQTTRMPTSMPVLCPGGNCQQHKLATSVVKVPTKCSKGEDCQQKFVTKVITVSISKECSEGTECQGKKEATSPAAASKSSGDDKLRYATSVAAVTVTQSCSCEGSNGTSCSEGKISSQTYEVADLLPEVVATSAHPMPSAAPTLNRSEEVLPNQEIYFTAGAPANWGEVRLGAALGLVVLAAALAVAL